MTRIPDRIALALALSLAAALGAQAGGFALVQADGAAWIFAEGSAAHEAWLAGEGLPEKHVTSFVSNEAGVKTFKSPEMETIQSFRAWRPGYETRVNDGAIWIFREGEAPEELPEKHVTSMEASAGAVTTYKSTDAETLQGYRASRPGFAAIMNGGYTWIFPAGSEGLREALAGELPEKHVTRMLAREQAVSIYKALDALTLRSYLDLALDRGRPGYAARVREGQLWVFEENGMDQLLADLGEFPEKHVTTMKATDGGVVTYKSPDRLTLKGFAAARPGHVVRPTEDGPVWVFLPRSPELAAFDAGERSEKHASQILATDGGVLTLKADTMELLRGHAASRPGFVARMRDGFLWIFSAGDPLLAEFDAGIELEKHVTSLLNESGSASTLKSPDLATLEAYRAVLTTPVG